MKAVASLVFWTDIIAHLYSNGVLGSGAGLILSVVEPTPARAATLADGFKSEEGIKRFFSLPVIDRFKLHPTIVSYQN